MDLTNKSLIEIAKVLVDLSQTERSEVLSDLIRRMGEAVRESIVDLRTGSISSELVYAKQKEIAEAVIEIAPILDSQMISVVVEKCVMPLSERYRRDQALAVLLPKWTDNVQNAISIALELDSEYLYPSMGRMGDDWNRCGSPRSRALVGLAPLGFGSLTNNVLQCVSTLSEPEDQAHVLIVLIPQVSEQIQYDVIRLTLETIARIEHPEAFNSLLETITPHLRAELIDEAFDLAFQVRGSKGDFWYRSELSPFGLRNKALSILESSNPATSTIERALDRCSTIEDEEQVFDTIFRISKKLMEPGNQSEIERILSEVLATGNRDLLLRFVSTFGKALAPLTIHHLVERALSEPDHEQRSRFLCILVPYIANEDIATVCEALPLLVSKSGILNINRPRLDLLLKLVERKHPAIEQRLNSVARRIKDPMDRFCALTALSVAASDRDVLFCQALEALDQAAPKFHAIWNIREEIRQLTITEQRQIYYRIRKIDSPETRADGLIWFPAVLSADELEEVITCHIEKWDRSSRPLAESFIIIFSYLPEPLQQKVVDRALSTLEAGTLKDFLSRIVSVLSRTQVDRLVTLALASDDDSIAGSVLTALARILPESSISSCWQRVRHILDREHVVEAQFAIARRCGWPKEFTIEAQNSALDCLLAKQARPRAEILNFISQFGTQLLSEDLALDLVDEIREICRVWTWPPDSASRESGIQPDEKLRGISDSMWRVAIPRVLDSKSLQVIYGFGTHEGKLDELLRLGVITWSKGLGWKVNPVLGETLLASAREDWNRWLDANRKLAEDFMNRRDGLGTGFRCFRHWQRLDAACLFHQAVIGSSELKVDVVERLIECYRHRIGDYALLICSTLSDARTSAGNDGLLELGTWATGTWNAWQDREYTKFIRLFDPVLKEVRVELGLGYDDGLKWIATALTSVGENSAASRLFAKSVVTHGKKAAADAAVETLMRASSWSDRYAVYCSFVDTFSSPTMESRLLEMRAEAICKRKSDRVASIDQTINVLRSCRRQNAWEPFQLMMDDGVQPACPRESLSTPDKRKPMASIGTFFLNVFRRFSY